jgi:microcystin-dependent protein
MAEPFLSEIRIMSFGFPPKGWALCDGQLLPINQNQALFSLLGTTYGGDGMRTFGLPDLRGKVPIHMGNGHTLGETAGSQAVTISIQQLPQHLHLFNCASSNTANATATLPTGNVFAHANGNVYATGSLTPLVANMVTSVGGNQPHQNMQPFLTLNMSIALQGIFPSQT